MATYKTDDMSLALWKLKRKIEFLENITIQGSTSAVSLYVRPTDNMTKIRQFVSSELCKADKIKSTQNKRSVTSGLGTILEMLKKMTMPINGFACFAIPSALDIATNKVKSLSFNLELPVPLQEFTYNCSGQIITQPLKDIIHLQPKTGYIIVDGCGALFATVQGRMKNILHKYSVNLPKKHSKGGQSQSRFARLRLESRHHYIKKVCEKAETCFIKDTRPIIQTFIIAGDAQFKEEIDQSKQLHPGLQELETHVVAVAYGGERGLEEAIKLSADFLTTCALAKEVILINKFLDYLNQGNDTFIRYGIEETTDALVNGLVEILIIWEDLPTNRLIIEETADDKITRSVKHVSPNAETNISGNIVESGKLIDWIVEQAANFQTEVNLVSYSTREGKMLIEGFGGIAAILRYSVKSNSDLCFDEPEEISPDVVDLFDD